MAALAALTALPGNKEGNHQYRREEKRQEVKQRK